MSYLALTVLRKKRPTNRGKVEPLQPVEAREACAQTLRHTEGPLDAWWLDERWFKASIEVVKLRTAHTDFREQAPVMKHELMRAVLGRNRQAILEDTFPAASRIKSGALARGKEQQTVMLLIAAVVVAFLLLSLPSS